MRVKILNTQDEKKINKEIDKIEKGNREVENIIPFKNKVWILHYPDETELEKEIKDIRKDYEEFKSKFIKQNK